MAVAAPQGAGTELGLQAALQGLRTESATGSSSRQAVRLGQPGQASVLIGSPDGGRRAGAADGARLLQRAQRQRVIPSAEQAVHLDTGAVSRRQDGDMAHAAATNPSLAGDRDSRRRIERFDRHASSLPLVDRRCDRGRSSPEDTDLGSPCSMVRSYHRDVDQRLRISEGRWRYTRSGVAAPAAQARKRSPRLVRASKSGDPP